ncbi:MAG: tyrosine-type recombinase/integrase [Mycobacterium sp.]|uniref:tyrosine-type recombinase/integrase n=1 Tax=Mycobacterium sp. TaxID=1785 RepID=UPI003F9662A2
MSTPKLAELVPSWVVALQAANRSAKTIKCYTEGVRLFLAWCDLAGKPAKLDRPTVQAFTASLLEANKSPATARARQMALKRFSAWCAAEGEIETNLLAGMGQPALHVKVTDPLTELELRDLIRACQGPAFRDRRDEAIVRLMAETGIRAGECAAMALADVDVVRGTALVRRAKGGRARIIPYGPQTAATLDRYIRMRRAHPLTGSPALWLGDRGKTFSYTALYRALARRARLTGIDDFYPHLLRHGFASRWLAAGGSEQGLMQVAGWRKREMLDRYTAATASDRAADEARRLRLGDL